MYIQLTLNVEGNTMENPIKADPMNTSLKICLLSIYLVKQFYRRGFTIYLIFELKYFKSCINVYYFLRF